MTPDAQNLATMARNRLDLPALVGVEELTERQAFSALSWWYTATGGLRFSDTWPGTVGIRAYHWVRGMHGQEARGIAGSERLQDDRVAQMTQRLALHLDWTAPDLYPDLMAGNDAVPLWLTELDVNGQYLSAAGGLQLGTGTPDLINAPRTLDAYKHMPGYVQLARRPDHLARYLPITWRAFDRLNDEGRNVITMNYAAWLIKRGVELDAAQLLLWPRSRQHLAAWVSMWRKAREYLAAYARSVLAARVALALLKEVTNTTLSGWMRSEDKNHTDLMNRAWSDAIITESTVRAMVAAERAGAAGFPAVGMRRDAAWFIGRRDLEPTGLEIDKSIWPTGRDGKLGKWKRTRCVPVTGELVDAIARSPEMVSRYLVAAVKAQREETSA